MNFLNSPLYKEGEFLIAFSRKILSINTGISTRILYLTIKDEKFKLAYLLDFGFHKKINKYSLAFSWKNITYSKLNGEELPVFLLWEMGYNISSNIKIVFGFEKQSKNDFIFYLATNYKINKYFNVFSGYRQKPSRIGAGFSILVKKILFSYSFLTHPALFNTHYFTLEYEY